MRQALLLIVLLGMVGGCATTPRQRRVQDLISCTKGFMEYNENVTRASQACMVIYAKPGEEEQRAPASIE